jgi:hypothetical protein
MPYRAVLSIESRLASFSVRKLGEKCRLLAAQSMEALYESSQFRTVRLASIPISSSGGSMNTAFILMAQYNGRAIIPLEQICKDYFTHLTTAMFQRKVMAGQIKIPITRMEPSQKSAKGIHITDLAAYLDLQREAAVKECNQLNGFRRAS